MRRGFRGRRNKGQRQARRGRPRGRRGAAARKRARLPDTAVMSRDLHARHAADGAWMILEVNDDGESLHERYELLEAEVIRVFGELVGFFIPAYIERIKDKVVGIDLIGGYLFVERTPESETAAAVMSSPYFKGRMPDGGRSGGTTGRDINAYKRKLLDSIKGLAPRKGATVVPKVGTFKSMEGKVVSVAKDRMSATVLFKKASRIVQAPVSVLNMEPPGSSA